VRFTSLPTATRAAPTAAHYRWAAVGAVAFTFYGGLLPFHFTPMPLNDAVSTFRQATVWDSLDLNARGDWVVSIAQYAVLSYALMAALCCDRRWAAGILAASFVIPVCIAIAVGIEFLQVYFPPRTVSVNDIFVETLGSLVGTAAWLAVGQRITTWARRLSGVTSVAESAQLLLPAYVIVLLVVQLMPFDFIVSRGELAAKVADGRVRLAPFDRSMNMATVGKAALNVAVFMPLGLLAALALRGRRQPDHPSVRLGIMLTAAIVMETLKLFVYSRTFDTFNILTSMIGVATGWWLGRVVRTKDLAAWAAAPRLGMFSLALWLAWFGAVAYCNWSPFNFTTNPVRFADDPEDLPAIGLRHMALAPFVDYYEGSKYNALDQYALKGLSFLPAGVLLALASRAIYSPGACRRAVGFAAAAAVIIEVGRYFLPSRPPSVTDILIQCAGVWLGFRLTQIVRASLWAEATIYGGLAIAIEPLHFITREPDILSLPQSR
jgi:VanZ family protein